MQPGDSQRNGVSRRPERQALPRHANVSAQVARAQSHRYTPSSSLACADKPPGPGSTPLYVGGSLQGGFGVSGDGVDQDDVVTFAGQQGFAAPTALKADQVFYRAVRLPFQKFNRTPLR